MKRLSSAELDAIAIRLEEIALEDEGLRFQVAKQIEEYGFSPPRAEKSKRLLGSTFSFTLSTSQTTEIRDAAVERIRAACPDELFSRLFSVVTKYKLTARATALLAGKLPADAPRNLRQLFSRAVIIKEGGQRLRVEKIEEEEEIPA